MPRAVIATLFALLLASASHAQSPSGAKGALDNPFVPKLSTVNFGSVQLGTSRYVRDTVTNAGTSTLYIISVVSTNAVFTVVPATGSIAPGGYQRFRITFVPVAPGTVQGMIVFSDSSATKPLSLDTVYVNGTGTIPVFSLSQSTLPFGGVLLGTSRTDSVLVTNAGGAPLAIASASSSNPDFTLSVGNDTIQPGHAQQIHITFTPSAEGPESSTITFVDNASTSPDTLGLSGMGTWPHFVISKNAIDFGNVAVGTSKPDSVVVTNTGSAPLVIGSVKPTNGAYLVMPISGVIQPLTSKTYFIFFSPTSSGTQSGSVIIVQSASTAPDTVSVTGTGTLPGFSVSRTSVSFGGVNVGSYKSDSLLVTNTGTGPLTISKTVSTNASFTVYPETVVIQSQMTQSFTVTFAPAAAGAQSGSLVFTHDAPGSPDTVSLSGSGLVPLFSVSRKAVPFGSVQAGTGKPDSVIVTNTGTAPLVIGSVSSTNTAYAVNPTSATIQPLASRSFVITFTPPGAGMQYGSLIFSDNAPSAPDTVSLSGTGVSPVFSAARSEIPFGTVVVGSSKQDSVLVTNAGSATLQISKVASDNSAFSVNPQSASISPSASKMFVMTFSPTALGAQSGRILFTHNAPGSPDTIMVDGTGTVAGFSISRTSLAFGNVVLGQLKSDSVIVSNTGSTTLVISSVSSSNGSFSVNPTSVSLGPNASRTFLITFAPTSAGSQSGGIIFTHNAPGSPDTLSVSGAGAVAAFSLLRKSISFGAVAIGTSRRDSTVVSNPGTAVLQISSVQSTNGTFVVNPTSATVPVSGSQTFVVTFTPTGTSAQSASILFWHNAPSSPDTLGTSGSGYAQTGVPVLSSPANGSSSQPVSVTLSWSASSNASAYWIELSTDNAFGMVLLSDSSLASTSRLAGPLAENTTYYWRVSAKAQGGFGPFSGAFSFSTISSAQVSSTVSFSGDVSSASYQMFSMPGAGGTMVSDLLSGTQKVDWRLLLDDGSDLAYPAYYVDLGPTSSLIPGESYWLLEKKDLVISRTVTLAPLSPDGTSSIPLHAGWNMIANPFNVSVTQASVIAANGLPPGTLFWEHVGTTRTSSGTTLDPFKGYYFDNDTSKLTSLKIPYPFTGALSKKSARPDVDWRMELVFDSDINRDRDNYVGIARAVKQGRNALDQHEPPLVFDQGFLYFVRPAWDSLHSRFSSDMRPSLGDGQEWDFEVWNPRRSDGTITFGAIEAVPAGYSVVLINRANSTPVDVRRQNVYRYTTIAPKMQFALLVGTQAFVESRISQTLPGQFSLAQNYPNPFNGMTTISYTLPSVAHVRLEIDNVLGQRVRVLYDGVRAPATYTVVWDGTDESRGLLSSGVYFCRLIANSSVMMTRKLVMVK
ncbi:MAG TPA: choice-of-anchor D domain-containing protein [Bacteroidota bacterium]|nr:choice-of-anchor D domain-containing protein [Bacteroidota bacterium]